MVRFLTFATIVLSIVSFASAQLVETLNTPIGPVSKGSEVPITWTLIKGVDATGKTGELSAQNYATKNNIIIEQGIPLAPNTYTWTVDVPPGDYSLGLNDGYALKQTGKVTVISETN